MIYEVELVNFIKRVDLDQNGAIFMQTLEKPTDKHDKEVPTDLDDIKAHVKVYQNRGDVFEPYSGEFAYEASLDS